MDQGTSPQRSSQLFQTLLDQAPLGMFLVDSAFTIRQINPPARLALGDVGEVVGQDFATVVRALWPQRLADEVIARFRHTLDTGESHLVPQFIDQRLTREGIGYYRWQINRITLSEDEYGVVCYFNDISDAVRSRQALVDVRDDAERRGRFFDTVLSSTPDLVYVFDLQHRFTYANAALLTMWGRSWDEAIGRTCLELGYEPWHAARHDREIEQVVATRQPVRGEVPFHGTNGRRIYDYIFVPILDQNGAVEAVAGTTRDVTDQESARASLQQSERLLSEAFERAPAFAAIVRGPDLVFEKVNRAYHEVVGINRALIGKPLLEALPELRDTPFIEPLRQVLLTGQPYRPVSPMSAMLRRSDSDVFEERWVDFIHVPLRDAEGQVTGVMSHGVDLTERILAERRLAENAQRFRFMLDAMPQKVFTAQATGEVDYFNPVWLAFTGLSFERIRDWGWVDIVHPDDVQGNVQAWQQAIDSGQPFQLEHRFRRADGEYRWHLSRAVAIRDDDGGVLMWIGSNTDIHEQREAANQLRAMTRELAGADRRKDEFIALLAHELRNPLAPIANALQIMRLSDGKKETVQFAAAVMERQLGQLVRLVDDLLDVSRITRGKIELRRTTLALSDAITHAIEAARPLAREMDQSLVVTLPPEPLLLNADPIRVAQIIGNLLTNAVKFTDRGGSIRLQVSRDGDQAVLRVTDTGIGIAPEQISRIFEMFTQLDTSLERSASGLGIGLSLVRTLVELHGGSIVAESPGKGQGSVFTVRLPLLATADEPASIAATAAATGRADWRP